MDRPLIKVLFAEPKNIVSSKTGKALTFLEIQGLVPLADGKQSVFKYAFWPAKGQEMPVLQEGRFYYPVPGVRVDQSSMKLEPAFVGFEPAPSAS